MHYNSTQQYVLTYISSCFFYLFLYFLFVISLCFIRSTIESFVKNVSQLAESLAEILAQPLGVESSYFKDHCPPRTSFLRLNRYAPCPFSSQVFGLFAHTDSAFLTIVHQDQVGGLELFIDGRWIGVKPNPEALVVNIGDFFEV